MKSMGYDERECRATPAPTLDDNSTEIVRPEDRYGLACIGCGIELHLQMIPHKDQFGILVGWVFSCEKCRETIIGQRVWFGGDEAKITGSSKDWDTMIHSAERLYQMACKYGNQDGTTAAALQNFIDAWDKMLD